MPKFSPGDPVWLRSVQIPGHRPNIMPLGEYAATISDEPIPYWIIPYGTGPIYSLDVQGYGACVSREEYLRPRRDDYQQHEGLGSIDLVSQPLADDKLPEPLPRHVVKAMRFAIMYGADPGAIRRMIKRG